MIDLKKERETVHNAINTSFDIAKVQKAEIGLLNIDIYNKNDEIDSLRSTNFLVEEINSDFSESIKLLKSEIDELKAKLAKVESGECVIVPKEKINALRDKAMDAKYFSENECQEYARNQFEEIQISLEAMIEAAQENEDE